MLWAFGLTALYVAPENEAAAKAALLAEEFKFGGVGWEAVVPENRAQR